MTTEQFEVISSLDRRIKHIKRLLKNSIRVSLVKNIDSDHICNANGFYLNELKLGEKISEVLRNAECEVGTILVQELDRLEKEFSEIIVGTELKTPDNENENS